MGGRWFRIVSGRAEEPERTVGWADVIFVLDWDGPRGVTLWESPLSNVSGTWWVERIPAGAEYWEDFL